MTGRRQEVPENHGQAEARHLPHPGRPEDRQIGPFGVPAPKETPSPREVEVIILVAAGLSHRRTVTDLGPTEGTAERHMPRRRFGDGPRGRLRS